jgi:hypothetical protein
MKVPDDHFGYDHRQALAIGHAPTDVHGNIPKAALESLREGRPGRASVTDVHGNRNIQPRRS